jgi:hypothetical protein
MLVPLAANAPSFGRAVGKAFESRVHTPTPIFRDHDVELSVDRITEDNTVISVPERHRIKKAFGFSFLN